MFRGQQAAMLELVRLNDMSKIPASLKIAEITLLPWLQKEPALEYVLWDWWRLYDFDSGAYVMDSLLNLDRSDA